MHFLCDEVGYNRTQPVDAADQEAEVARQMDAAARRFDSAVKRLERIRNSDALKHIRTLK
jgi:hypothetical protein